MSQSKAAAQPSAEHQNALTYDFSAEEAVYRREREPLIRDHLKPLQSRRDLRQPHRPLIWHSSGSASG